MNLNIIRPFCAIAAFMAYHCLLTPVTAAKTASWLIVGAGPAGITVTGLLLDMGFSASDIIWADPEYNIGRLGQYYETVPGNSKAKLYVEFLQSCKAFQSCKTESWNQLLAFDPEQECDLSLIINPLKDVTKCLKTRVTLAPGYVSSLYFNNTDTAWHAHIKDAEGKLQEVIAKNVVLATGSKPRSLNYTVATEIPLDIALQQEELPKHINNDDTIAVVGSAHSAVLIMKFLYDAGCNRIMNFYKTPLTYTYTENDIIYNEYEGLKGCAAHWARTVLEKEPARVIRIKNTAEAQKAWLPLCNKIVYAVGYERNPLPDIPTVDATSYDPQTGYIAPGLFGIGIAFPEIITDATGNIQHRIGLSSFMNFALRQLPGWEQSLLRIKTDLKAHHFDALFSIIAL